MEQFKEYAPIAQKAVGTILTAKGELDAGQSANALSKYQAKQLRQNAGQEVAASQVAAEEERRKSEVLASRAIAVAAASGAGTLDPTVVKIIQGVHGEGELAAQNELYNGNERARYYNGQADATRYEGKMYKAAGKKKALNTILNGAQSMTTTWGGADDKGWKGSPQIVKDLNNTASKALGRYS